MTAVDRPESTTRSRRAVLAGVVGGIGAFLAAAVGRAAPARASDPNDVVLGSPNTASTTTSITNSTTNAAVFSAVSTSGIALRGESEFYDAIWGVSDSGAGVFGKSTNLIAVGGESNATSQPAVRGAALGNSTGVLGYSGNQPNAKPKTGAYGFADQDGTSKGVWGSSPAGHGLHGQSSSGWAGYFDGRVLTKKYHELVEIETPSAPGANHVRLFIRDNGSGKTQLCVRFATGAVKVLATQG